MDLRTLTQVYDASGPFVTVYLDTSGDSEDAAAVLETRWKNLLRDLADAGVDEATCDALSDVRGGVRTGGSTRVLVAAGGKVQLATSLAEPPPRDELTLSPLPRLLPLVDSLTLSVPHVVVLADRTGADVLAYTTGDEPAESGSVDNDRFPQRKPGGKGGWSAKRYSNDVEETWEASARDVAGLVERVARDIGAEVVVASGDNRALQLLGEHLPAALHGSYVTIGGGGRAKDGSEDVIAEDVLRVLADTVAARTIDLLERFSQARGRDDGLAADGVTATIAALRMAQVDTLVLTDARDEGRTAWFGPEPTQLAATADELTTLGVSTPQEATLDEVLLRAALCTDATVRLVGGGMEQSPSEGVGALLRFANDPNSVS